MSRRRRSAVALGVCASLVTVAGCAGSGTVDGPVLASPPSAEDAGMDAEVRGSVQIRGDCLLLVQEDVPDSPAYPVLWPAGTTWQTQPPAVVLEDGRLVEPGRQVRGSGGYLQASDLEDIAGTDVAAAAARCTGDTGEVAVFNAGSDVQVG